ncbi:MAG: hypothetical protein AAFU79_28655, partial [Myxococcota bacterium]
FDVPEKFADAYDAMKRDFEAMKKKGKQDAADDDAVAAMLAQEKVRTLEAAKRADTAEGEVAGLTAKVEELEAEKAQRADAGAEDVELFEGRAELVSKHGFKASDVVKLDAAGVLRARAEKLLPSLDLEGKSEDFIRGALAQAPTQPRADGATRIADAATNAGRRSDKKESALDAAYAKADAFGKKEG